MSNHSKDTAQMLIDEAYSKALKAMHKIDCIAYFDGPHRVDDLDRVADDYHSYAMCILDAIQDLHRSGGAQNIMRPVSRHLGALMVLEPGDPHLPAFREDRRGDGRLGAVACGRCPSKEGEALCLITHPPTA